MSLPISVGTTALADRFILFLYSSAYANSILALRILIWALVFIFFNSLLSFVLYSAEKQRFLVLTTGGMLALNVLLNLWLIPRFSYLAASYTTVLTEVAGFAANFAFVSRTIARVGAASPMLKAGVGSLAMVTVIYLWREANLALLLMSSALIYLGFLFVTGAIDAEDRTLLKGVLLAGS